MKVSGSIPDEPFGEAPEAAQSPGARRRQLLYTDDQITALLNVLYSQVDSSLDEIVIAAQARILDEW